MSVLYRVQAGAYRVKANAEKQKKEIEAALEKRRKAGKLKEDFSIACLQDGDFWKVQCGAFRIRENADKRLRIIHEAGFTKAMILEAEDAAGVKEKHLVSGPEKVLKCMEPYIDSPTAHRDAVNAMNLMMEKLGHSKVSMDDAWCTEFVDLMFYEAGFLPLIGYAKNSGTLVSTAKKNGTWKETATDIVFGDVVIFHDGKGNPNHTEFALDGKYDISGNYNGGVHKRSRTGRRVLGRIRPKYPSDEEQDVRIRFWGIRFWESNPSKYGDAECFIEYADTEEKKAISHVVLIDTGMNGTDTVKKLQAAGVKKIDAVLISHDHSDHYGFLSSILQTFEVLHVYLPDQSGVDRYLKTYGNRIRTQEAGCRKKGVPVTYLKAGDSFEAGKIRCDVLFQADAKKLPEKEGHHFINDMSLVCRFTVNGIWVFHLAGDSQNDANNQLLSAFLADRLKCDVFKVQWHGDRGAISRKLVKALSPVVALSNYHKKESKSNGRKATYDILRDVGCLVMRNCEDGEVYMDMEGNTMTVTGSLTKTKKVFTKQMTGR